MKNGSAVDAGNLKLFFLLSHKKYLLLNFLKAIASGLCNGLMNSHSAGIGGGHFMTIYLKSKNRAYVINARERAPLNANYLMFQNRSSTNGNIYFRIQYNSCGLSGKSGASTRLIDKRSAHTFIIRSR